MEGGEGLTKEEAPRLESNMTFNCDRLFTFAPPKLRLFFTSGVCPGSLVSHFTWNGPSFVKSCLNSFSILLLCPKPSSSKADDYNLERQMAAESLIQRKQTDQLKLNAVLTCEFPENFFQTLSSSLHWKLLLFIENKLEMWKSFLVFRPSSLEANASSKLIAGSHVSHSASRVYASVKFYQ